MRDTNIDLRIWGKSRGLAGPDEPPVTYPLICHLLDTAAMAGAIWDDYLSFGLRRRLSRLLDMAEVECRSFLMLLAGVHDIGKACPGFQRQVAVPEGLDPEGDCTDHALAGHLWVGAILQHKYECTPEVAVRIGEIVGGHHGAFDTIESAHFGREAMAHHGLGRGDPWGRQRLAVFDEVWDLLIRPRLPNRIPRPAQVVACAVVILADWLASRTDYVKSRFPKRPRIADREDLLRCLDQAMAGAGDELRAAGLRRLSLLPGTFRDEFGFEPNRLQASLEAALPDLVRGPGLLIVTEQTGQGKTEAALYAARLLGDKSGTAGTAFLLPTMATSNAMEDRLKKYLNRRATGPAALNLLHSMAWLRSWEAEQKAESGPEVSSESKDVLTTVTDWLSGGKKAAFALVGVGTIDQALLSVLPLRHNAFRLLAFANKTVVIDEVHAFDSYVYELLSKFLAWCGELKVPVVLMSATLPRHIARRLAAAYLGKPALSEEPIETAYPGWAFIPLEGGTKVTSLKVPQEEQGQLTVQLSECEATDKGLDRLKAIQKELEPLRTSDGCAVVICTTVKEAQRTFESLHEWQDQEGLGIELVLLHSNMPLHQRERITDDIVKRFGRNGDRSGKTVVVSTQVIEQSVDIDMDLVITDLAPLELLLQRAGRGHRHPENNEQRPKWAKDHRLVVLTPVGGNEPRIPKTWELIYPRAMLIRTQRLLLNKTHIEIPGEVQALVDQVHTDPSLIVGHEKDDTSARANAMVQSGEAGRISVPRPIDLGPIIDFSKGANKIDEEHASTRFNADSVRTLPVFEHEGNRYLDPNCEQRLPTPYRKDGAYRWSRDDLAAIMTHTVPVNGAYLTPEARQTELPPGWSDHRQLKYIVLLPHKTKTPGHPTPAKTAGHTFYLDPTLGLTIDHEPTNGKVEE